VGKSDLTVEVTPIMDLTFTAAICSNDATDHLACGRCEAPNELVVAVLEIAAIGANLALFGLCLRELPSGFQAV
jgi:hypothetical protein